MKRQKTPLPERGGTRNVEADTAKFLSLLLELAALDHEKLEQFGKDMKVRSERSRRSHIPNKKY